MSGECFALGDQYRLERVSVGRTAGQARAVMDSNSFDLVKNWPTSSQCLAGQSGKAHARRSFLNFTDKVVSPASKRPVWPKYSLFKDLDGLEGYKTNPFRELRGVEQPDSIR